MVINFSGTVVDTKRAMFCVSKPSLYLAFCVLCPPVSLFNAKLSSKRHWWGPVSQEVENYSIINAAVSAFPAE